VSRAEPLEAVTLLCGSCGAPALLEGVASIRCRRCGALERLPDDQLRRHEILDHRFRDAVRRDLALRGLVSAYARTYDGAPARAWLVPALFGAAALLAGLVRAGTRDGVVVAVLVTSVVLVLAGAVRASHLLARRAYVRHVRPHIVALAPAAPGEPFGCRVCGAPLPSARTAHRACRHCASTSIVPEPAFARELSRAAALATDRTAETRLALTGAREVARVSRRALASAVALGLALVSVVIFARFSR
jgi:hypothetical protein